MAIDKTSTMNLGSLGVGGTIGSADLAQMVSGVLPSSGQEVASSMGAFTQSLQSLVAANQTQTGAIGTNTTAILQNTAAQANTSSKSVGGTIGSIATSIFGSGLGLVPVISAISSLFGGGSTAPPPTLVKYVAPPQVAVDTPIPQSQASYVAGASAQQASGSGSGGSQAASQGAAPQVTIQVQAMDSRSFLDHSNDIAMAVRQAMLNLSSLNDVVNDL